MYISVTMERNLTTVNTYDYVEIPCISFMHLSEGMLGNLFLILFITHSSN